MLWFRSVIDNATFANLKNNKCTWSQGCHALMRSNCGRAAGATTLNFVSSFDLHVHIGSQMEGVKNPKINFQFYLYTRCKKPPKSDENQLSNFFFIQGVKNPPKSDENMCFDISMFSAWLKPKCATTAYGPFLRIRGRTPLHVVKHVWKWKWKQEFHIQH